MARHRNWDPRTWAEVFVRIVDLKQSPYRVAKATGLSYMQVQHWASQVTDTHVPPNLVLPSEETIEEVRTLVIAASEAEDVAARATKAQPIDEAALNAEVEGCIDLVRQAASQFGITPRRFLWLCSTHARSA